MGGVIAKAVFGLATFDPSDVSLILTLASPHRRPVIAMDSAIVHFYKNIKTAWKYRLKAELRNIPVISIGGGRRDVLVRSDLIMNDFEHSSSLDIHVLTSAIPGAWVSTDHLAIIWCKQLVLTICRSLFDLSDPEKNQIITDPSTLEDTLKFYYYSRSSVIYSPSRWFFPSHTFPSSGQWIEQEANNWRFSRSKVLSSIYILIPLTKNGSIIVVASGLNKGNWIFGCTQLSKTDSKTCSEGINLSNRGEIIPSRKANIERRVVNFRIQELHEEGYSSLLIFISPVDSQVEILGEVYPEAQRLKYYSLPSVFERLFSYASYRIFTISLVEQIVYYNITVSKSCGVFHAVEFQLETRLCRSGSVVGQGIVKIHIPWSMEDSYHHIRTSLGGLTTIPVHVHSLAPAEVSPDVNLLFIFDPECSVVLTARFPFYLIASQFMKFYGTYIIGYTVAFLVMFLCEQMYTYASVGTLPSVYKVFGKNSFLSLVILPSVLYHLIWASGFKVPFLPHPDHMEQCYTILSTFILRTLLYLISSGFVICLFALTELLLRGITTAWIYTMHKSILKTTQMPLEQTMKVKVKISKILLMWSSLLAAIAIGISSSLAAVITSFYYFCKLSSMHIRCRLEEERRGSSSVTSKWCFHLTLVQLWFITTALTYPGLIAWGKNLKFSLKLSSDMHVLPCIVLILSSAVLWQLPTPIINRYQYRKCTLLMLAVAVITTLFGISSVYRLLYYIASVFVIISIQEMYGYFQIAAYLKYD